MNSDSEELKRQLEQATAREVNESWHLDGQAELLRESWLAFGQLLEAADREDPAVAVILPLPVRSGRQLWKVIAAVAASVAAVFGGSWYLVNTTTRSLKGSPTEIAVRVESSPTSGKLQRGTMANELVQNEAELAWDDLLDDRLHAASLALWQTHGSSRHYDSRWNSIRDTVQQMDEEISGDSL